VDVAKKKKPESEMGSSWLASYADLMTILFIVFVVLYALADIDDEAWGRFAEAMARRSASGAIGVFDSSSAGINELMGSGVLPLPDMAMSNFRPAPSSSGEGGPRNHMEVVGEELRAYFADIGASDNISVVVGEGGEHISIVVGEGLGEGLGPGLGPGPGGQGVSERGAMFDSGSAVIRREFLADLAAIGNMIASIPNVHVAVVGHTDNVPIRGGTFADNWDLSNARALSVLRYFVYDLRVIEPDRISATGHGEHRPVAPNNTAEGRQLNRRVEIILTQN
jgi:chemotaxis protein MotB